MSQAFVCLTTVTPQTAALSKLITSHESSNYSPPLTRVRHLQHMAELTVRETLDFSRRVQGSGNQPRECHNQNGKIDT